MGRLGDEDAAEPVHVAAWIGHAEELELVEPLQVEREAARRPVQLDAQPVLAPGRVPGRLEGGQGPGGELRGEHHRVVHRDRAPAGTTSV